jgi:hypothetical protein
VVGAVMWVLSLTLAGYWFGGLEIVKNNFSLVIIAIIVISILPAVWEVLRARRSNGRGKPPGVTLREPPPAHSGDEAQPAVTSGNDAQRDAERDRSRSCAP